LDADWTWGPIDAPGECLFCGRAVELYYRDGVLWLTCGNDDHSMGLWASPALLDSHTDEEIIAKVAFLGNQWAAKTRRGICSDCQGPVDGHIEYGGTQADHYHYLAQCDHCDSRHGIPLGLYVLGHPTVWAFYDDHDIDIRTTPFWTVSFARPGSETILSEEPLRLRVEITHDDDSLSLAIAEDGSIERPAHSTSN
jgi:hypothetical protein